MATETVLVDIEIERDEADFQKLANLKGTLQGLKQEQKDLTAALKAQTITQKEYNSEIVRVEALQKKVGAEYNKTQRAVTGLKNPFDNLNDAVKKQNDLLLGAVPALDKVTGGAASAASGLFQMVKAAVAFVATPLGLVLSGIALAIIPIITYFKNTGEGADILNRHMEGLKSTLQKVGDEFIRLGKATLQFLEENTPVTKNLNVVETAFSRAAKAGRIYADALDDLRDSEEDYGIEAARTENEIKRLLLQAKNRTLTEQERIDLINRALSLEGAAVSQRKAFADQEFSIIVERNRKRLEEIGIIQKADETQNQFVENNIDRIRDFDEKLATSLITSLKKIEEATGSGIAIEEKAQNQLDALAQKAEEANKKREEDAFKRSEEERKRRIEDFDAKLEIQENEIISDQEKADFDLELDNIVKTGLEERLKTHEDNKKKTLKAALEFEKGVLQARIGLFGQFGAALIQLGGRNKLIASAGVVIERAASVASIIANTAAANAKAVKDSPLTFGMPWVGINSASAAISIFSTIGAAAQALSAINSAKGFSRGGYTGRGGILEPAGIVHKGEVVWSQADVAASGGPDRVNRMRPTYKRLPGYATGGVVGNETRIATQQANSQVDINQMAQLLNQVRTILVLEDFQAKEAEVNGLTSRANVVG